MEKVVTEAYLRKAYSGKRVFLTGHTGFKGSWMLQILHWLGANVKGYSLAPEKPNDLYHQVQGDKLCYSSVIADVCDKQKLQTEMARFEPDFVFHLAAQPLVRRGYDMPSYTFMVNAQGTAHVLDAMRCLTAPAVGVMITTDKVYDNPERGIPFAEDDKLGGYDPYSASKASAEIVIDSYRRSFFNPAKYDTHKKSIASARAGNVIGGGDYSDDRIVADIVRAISFGDTVTLRNPASVRPWQHVLEPVVAYLALGAHMAADPVRYSTAYNFGPDPDDMLTVEELTKEFIAHYGQGAYEATPDANAPHEAKLLLLNSEKALNDLGWRSLMDARTAIRWTAEWYADKQTSAYEKCMQQIKAYFS
ncbi:CDP-glucose 4,6-dehydratase [Nemorincola caseinilytica]|uniref:CDP-glucose 4,6-dehydratase n=1 Tax=Nemorincola caseinilytica TaxID=2054315 RepID=A0ABP8N7C2_9BACT